MEDWEKKYWNQKIQQMKNNPQDLPHHEPVHKQQDRQRVAPSDQWREVDPLTAMYGNMDGMASRGMGPQSQTVQLREGAVYYKKVETGEFGTTMPMVRSCGPITGIVGRDFELKQACHCYVIDNLQVVDLSQINPKKMMKLVEVRAPFIGSVLVDESAVIAPGDQGPKVLKG